MTDGLNHSQAVATDREKSVDIKPFVNFNWHNGALTSVSVKFSGIQSGKTTGAIAGLSTQSIAARFKQSPKRVVIS
jgi:hypothetical protein